jgi:O-antigen/teichoic acid export membrane protein
LILTHYKGVEELGVFAALTYLASVFGTVVAAVGGVASPRIAEWYSEGMVADIKRLMHKMLCFDILLGIGLLVVFGAFSKTIFQALLSAEIARFSFLGIWMAGAAGMLFLESHLGVVATSMGLLMEQVPIQAVRMITAIGLALILIPSRGVIGAVWSLMASIGLTSVLYYAMCVRALKQTRKLDPHVSSVSLN